MFQDREQVPREVKEKGIAIKLKDRASNLMHDVLKRDPVNERSTLNESRHSGGTDVRSKYKQIHEKWLHLKENNSNGMLYESQSPVKAPHFYPHEHQQQ